MQILVNALQTTIPEESIYHYDVVVPEKKPDRFNRDLVKALVQNVAPQVFNDASVVYDGKKNIYSNAPLAIPDGGASVRITAGNQMSWGRSCAHSVGVHDLRQMASDCPP